MLHQRAFLLRRNIRVADFRNGLQRRHTANGPVKLTDRASDKASSRIQRINARRTIHNPISIYPHCTNTHIVPRFLQPYTTPLLTAPVSHITSFLILHELTAIIPLVGLATTFHYTNWLPPYISEGAWVKEGVEKFGRYFRKKGWFGEGGGRREGAWTFSENGVKIVVEVATAWAVTKALLPLRLVVSVWGTPWFARVFVTPITRWTSKAFRRGRNKTTVVSGAAGAGSVAAGAVPKSVGSIGQSAAKPKA
jgi:hypothetical protein